MLYSNKVLLHVLPILTRDAYCEIAWATVAQALGIPTVWVGRALDDLVKLEYLMQKQTEKGAPTYCPNTSRPEIGKLFELAPGGKT